MEKYPDVAVELVLSDRMIDLVEDGIDAAIRVGPLPDSTMMSRALSPYTGVVCAAPAYLEKHGTPQHPHDLAHHECLRYPDWTERQRWTFLGPEGEIEVEVRSRLTINNALAIREAALAGAGIVLQRDEFLADDIAAGRLQVLLPDYTTQSRARHVVWLRNRKMTPKLRAFIDFIAEVYG
jgi:DNA-binding transcriptional LysR family regulator